MATTQTKVCFVTPFSADCRRLLFWMCGEGLATTLPMVAPLNAFPFRSPRGPLQDLQYARATHRGKSCYLYSPLQASLQDSINNKRCRMLDTSCSFWSCGEGGIRSAGRSPSSRGYLLAQTIRSSNKHFLSPQPLTCKQCRGTEQSPAATFVLEGWRGGLLNRHPYKTKASG